MALSKKTRKALDDAFEAMSEEQAHAFLIFLAPFFEEDDSDVMDEAEELEDEDEEEDDEEAETDEEEDEDEDEEEADEEEDEDEEVGEADEDEDEEVDEDEDEDEEEADEEEDEDEEEADEEEDDEEEEEPVKPTRKKPVAAAPIKKKVPTPPPAPAPKPTVSKGVDLTLDTEELEKLAIKYRLNFAPAKKETFKRKHLITAFTAFNAAHKKLGKKPFDQLLKIAAKAGVSYKQDKGRPDPEKNKNQLIAMLVNEGAV